MKHTAGPDRPKRGQQEPEQRIVTSFPLLIGEKQPDSPYDPLPQVRM
jgi:hypothetical protein